jgi:hypothetical protein
MALSYRIVATASNKGGASSYWSCRVQPRGSLPSSFPSNLLVMFYRKHSQLSLHLFAMDVKNIGLEHRREL